LEYSKTEQFCISLLK